MYTTVSLVLIGRLTRSSEDYIQIKTQESLLSGIFILKGPSQFHLINSLTWPCYKEIVGNCVLSIFAFSALWAVLYYYDCTHLNINQTETIIQFCPAEFVPDRIFQNTDRMTEQV